jgi:hypothetical protein
MDATVEQHEQLHNETDSYVTASSIAELAKDRLGADQAARFVKRCSRTSGTDSPSPICIAYMFTELHLHCKRNELKLWLAGRARRC